MQIEKICKYIIYGGLFIIPFLAFVVFDSTFFPFITGKNFTFRILVEIMLASWAILAILNTSYRPRVSGILVALATFLGVITLANIFGENPAKSFWSNYERMEGLITHIHLFAYFIVAVSILNTEKLWNRLFQVSLGASVIMGVYVVFQLLGFLDINQGDVRVDGRLGNATYLASYALFHIFLSAWMYVRTAKINLVKYAYIAIALTNLFVLYNTQTRGAILGLIAGALLTAILVSIFAKDTPRLRKIATGIIITIIVFVGAFVALKDTTFVSSSQTLSRFADISFTEQTTKSRFQIWGIAIEGFKERPILGWGQENFSYVFSKYYDPRLYDQEPFFDRAHNVFLDWLTAGGILGLTSYLAIFIVTIVYIWRRGSRSAPEEEFVTGKVSPLTAGSVTTLQKAILTGLLGAYFFQNLFVFDNTISYILFFSVLAYIHTIFSNNGGETSVVTRNWSTTQKHIAIASIIITLAVVMYVINIKNISANVALIQAISPHPEIGLQANVDYFQKSIARGAFGDPEARERLLGIATQVSSMQNAPQETKQAMFNLARAEMLKQIEETPNEIRAELLLGTFLRQFRANEEAIQHIKRAIEISPNKQSVYLELVAIYVNQGDYTKALETARLAHAIEESNKNTLDAYAASAIYAGETKLAQDLLMDFYGTLTPDSDAILNAYAATKQHDKTVEIWENRIKKAKELGSENSQMHTSLAAAYLALGERERAIKELETAIDLNPEFKDQGQYYIDEIRAGRNP